MKSQNILYPLLFIPSLLFSCAQGEVSVSTTSSTSVFPFDEEYEEEEVIPSDVHVSVDSVRVPYNDFHTPLQYAYLSSSYDSINTYAYGTSELSRPNAISLTLEELEEAPSYLLEIADNRDFHSSWIVPSDSKTFDVFNLKIDTLYYYRAGKDYQALKEASIHEFTTNNIGPRNLYVDGVTNVRDIGGYTSHLGGKVRQGLYYRGGRLNKTGVNKFAFDITEDGLDTLIYDLEIQNEIDLRMSTEGDFGSYNNEFGYMSDDAIPEISYHSFPLDWRQEDMMKQSKEMIHTIFSFFAQEENYPIYLHCNIGTDRTGLITYLLGTLIGIPQEDLFRDYLFSNFGNINGSRPSFPKNYIEDLKAYHQKNMYLNVRDYLVSTGVTEEELDQIINIFLYTNE